MAAISKNDSISADGATTDGGTQDIAARLNAIEKGSDMVSVNECSIESVLDAERRRGEALVAKDLVALRELLAEDLSHSHTRGVTDTLESFLHFVEHDIRYLDMQRDDLTVRLFGSVAIMTGNQTNRIEIRSASEPMTSRSCALQIWIWRNGRWQMNAFQSTTLPTTAEDRYSSYRR